ncbi:ATP-binding protein [Mangrovivirga sp. M17]|uniref:ATP-binding protein n=1 Tax=Mangrovivirga halotolerans TaxID=2993936 RepID=A0ABT3RQF2_9BACT|nr:ATP-binding protein [Mangrovivirga halotolerans]
MNKETIAALEEALMASPENVILRKQIANGYFGLKEYEFAKEHLKIILSDQNDFDSKVLLAKCYLHLENYYPGILVCEELLEEDLHEDVIPVYLQLLINNGQIEDAVEQYNAFQLKLPDYYDEVIESQLKITVDEPEHDGSAFDAFLEKPDADFSRVGGMQNIKDEISIKIIQPLQNPDLYKAFGKKAGGGILMYGPPGCGKTFLARATAGEIDSRFMNVDLDDIMDMYIGNSEKNLHQRFEICRQHNPCVMFIDEIDALGSKRNDLKNSAGRNVINQFLKELDGVDTDNEGLLVLGATNAPWHMDSAFLRPGRFDRVIFVPPPDYNARIEIFKLMTVEKPIEYLDYEKLAKKTEKFSGADIKAVIDVAIEEKLRISMRSGKIEKLNTKDLLKAIKTVKPSTSEWFATAKNYALYSNASGLYDDVKEYLNL